MNQSCSYLLVEFYHVQCEPEPFIMKRFRNVKGKYQQDRERAAAERKANQRAAAAAATTSAACDAGMNAPNADEPAQSDEDAS